MPHIVDVTVGSGGTVTANPDTLSIPAGDRQPIQWRITNPPTEGWRFKRNGIEIPNPGSPPEFANPNGGGTRVYTWDNKHTRSGNYPYKIWVENDSGGAQLDPVIMNL